jgi:predicted metalloprotease with PDZ domain
MDVMTRSVLRALGPVLILSLQLTAFGQERASSLACRVFNISPASRSLEVACTASRLSGPMAGPKVEIRFLDSFAGIERLSDRIFKPRVRDSAGVQLQLEIRGGGLYSFKLPASGGDISLSYEIHFSNALEPSQYALASNLGSEAGHLMMTDLIPRLCPPEGAAAACGNTLRLRVEPPSGWKLETIAVRNGDWFEITDRESTVIFLGQFRERVTNGRIRIAIAGLWPFTDQQVDELVGAIARDQAQQVQGTEAGDFLVTLAPFPIPMTGLRSSGLARGHSIILLFNPGSDPKLALKHYERHLAHEMFHFYLPNAFRVREDFDWFWEGFTRYVALTTLLRTHQLEAKDYLEALEEEYAAYSANGKRGQLSLIAAAPDRFGNRESYEIVYRKGMLVAALYDLELRWQSKGKHSLSDVMRTLYQNYGRRQREVGNKEVIAELLRQGNFKQFVQDYIEGTREIELASTVAAYGFVVDPGTTPRSRPQLVVAPKLSEHQRELIDGLSR